MVEAARVGGVLLASLLLLVVPPLVRPAVADCAGGVPFERAITALADSQPIEDRGIRAVRGAVLVEAVATAPQTWISEPRARATVVRHWGSTDGIELTRIVDAGAVWPVATFGPVDDCVGSLPSVGTRVVSLVTDSGVHPIAYEGALDDLSHQELHERVVARLNTLDVPQRDDPITLTDRVPAWVAVWWPYVAVGLLLLAIPVRVLQRLRRRRAGPPAPT